jgi:hypothetical protein
MKTYFVTTSEGYIKTENANEAIEILKETENAIEAVEVEHEDDIYSTERTILAKK